MELSAELVFVLGLLSTVIVWLLKEAFVKKGKVVPQYIYNIVLGVVALALSFAFGPVVLPPFPAHDGTVIGVISAVLSFISALLPVLLAAVGFAKVIYEDLLERVFKGMGNAVRMLFRPYDGSDIG